MPKISPYQELQNEVDAANSMVQLWTMDLATAQQSKRQGYLGRLSPKAREETMEAAEQSYRELVIRADERGIERWHDVAVAIRKAHSDAITRMSQPGPMQWTPNQISKDKAEFDGLITSMERRTEDPDNPDKHRFEPLLNYLKRLQNMLGDYPEQ